MTGMHIELREFMPSDHTVPNAVIFTAYGGVLAVQMQEIKRLEGIMASMRSERSKQEGYLEECQRLQAFLDLLTPPGFHERLRAERDNRHAVRTAAWAAECEGIVRRQQEAAVALSTAGEWP